MSLVRKISQRIKRRALRVRKRIGKTGIRISVFRSLNHIYAQIIDDNAHKTLMSCSSLELKNIQGDKKAVAYAVGKELAQRATREHITSAVFDRGAFLYHGRVKSLADGIREGGLHI